MIEQLHIVHKILSPLNVSLRFVYVILGGRVKLVFYNSQYMFAMVSLGLQYIVSHWDLMWATRAVWQWDNPNMPEKSNTQKVEGHSESFILFDRSI